MTRNLQELMSQLSIGPPKPPPTTPQHERESFVRVVGVWFRARETQAGPVRSLTTSLERLLSPHNARFSTQLDARAGSKIALMTYAVCRYITQTLVDSPATHPPN